MICKIIQVNVNKEQKWVIVSSLTSSLTSSQTSYLRRHYCLRQRGSRPTYVTIRFIAFSKYDFYVNNLVRKYRWSRLAYGLGYRPRSSVRYSFLGVGVGTFCQKRTLPNLRFGILLHRSVKGLLFLIKFVLVCETLNSIHSPCLLRNLCRPLKLEETHLAY